MTSIRPEPTWTKEDYGPHMRERRAHIEQKLGHIAGARASVDTLAQRLPLLRDWVRSLRYDGSRIRDALTLLDPEFVVRLMSAALELRHALTSVHLVDQGGVAASRPGVSGPPESGTVGPGSDAELEAHAATTAQVLDAGDVWAGGGFADVLDEFGFTAEMDEGLGSFFASYLWSWLTSPFESYQKTKFTWLGLEESERFREEHGDDLADADRAFQAAEHALERFQRVVENAASAFGGTSGGLARAEADLRDALDRYQQAYDSAPGSEPPPPQAGGGDLDLDEWIKANSMPLPDVGYDAEPDIDVDSLGF